MAQPDDLITKWDVNATLDYSEAVERDDPRWVDTSAARGEFSFDPLYISLGVDPATKVLQRAPNQAYVLFCGHTGCGKSTELRRARAELHHADAFFTVFIDAGVALDPNNIQYQEVYLALAKELLAELPPEISVEPVHLRQMEDWFNERIKTQTWSHELEASVETGAEIEAGIPFFSRLFAKITAAFKTNSSYKDELRTVVRNSFKEFADAFNQLTLAVEQELERHGRGKRVLFIVDGTDKLSADDAKRFFIQDVHQLKQVSALFVYTMPIHLLHGGIDVQAPYTGSFSLPMIKVRERDHSVHQAGHDAMKAILLARAPRYLFDDDATIDHLIEHSGGHPRDLLRLLGYTIQNTRTDTFDLGAAERAVAQLANDYRLLLDATDYVILRGVDEQPEVEHNSERVRHLLSLLTLLQYNSYWWRSHPAVRTLDSYQRAVAGSDASGDG